MIHPSAHAGVEEGEVGHEAVVGKDSVSPQRLTGSVFTSRESFEKSKCTLRPRRLRQMTAVSKCQKRNIQDHERKTHSDRRPPPPLEA